MLLEYESFDTPPPFIRLVNAFVQHPVPFRRVHVEEA